MKKTASIFCLLFFSCCFGAMAQDTSGTGKAIISKLKAFLADHITEKAYLHFDKSYYAAGDTIYFKAYVTAGERHQLSALSGVLYVDLINSANKINQSIKLHLINGLTSGDFTLPDSLSAGNYRVRAYTQWMRNEGNEAFFERLISIGSNQPKKIAESALPGRGIIGKPDIQFLPEGGNLVNGIKSKVAFKAIDVNGKGIAVSGTVFDNTHNEVCRFASAHLGMGFFDIQPQDKKSYVAAIDYGNGLRDTVKLPTAVSSGIALSVNNDSLPKATVKIVANDAYFKQNKGKNYTLLIFSGGIATSVTCKLDSTVTMLDIVKRRLRTGVATVSLFSPAGEPLAERLLFVQNYDQLNIGINSDKASYGAREHIKLNLIVKNRADSAMVGGFSVSVVDESKVAVNENEEHTILTDLLLTSDLKGYVEQPNYYFLNASDEARSNLDLVMLTHGYRRFEWKPLITGTYPAIAYQAERSLTIAGTAKTLGGKPLTNGTISLIAPFTNRPVLSEVTDGKGNFRFNNLTFADTGRYILQAVSSNGGNNTVISYEPGISAPVEPRPYEQMQLPDTGNAIKEYLRATQKHQEQLYGQGKLTGKMLREVDIKARKLEKPVISGHYGVADQVINGKDIPFGGDLSDRLEGRIPRVDFIRIGKGNSVVLVSHNSIHGLEQPMRIVVDGAEMPRGFDINTISTGIIDKIEIMNSAAVSDFGTIGAVLITLKHGYTADEIPSKGILAIKAIGFYKSLEFYSPKYESPDMSKISDLRSTIYWNPEIITDKNGSATFDYYNAGAAGSYRVVIEGIDSQGNLGRKTYHYKIEN